MDRYGTIEPANGGKISFDRWVQLIAELPSLASLPDVRGMSPATGKPIMIPAPESTAQIVVNESELGTVYWAEDESETLIVHTTSDRTEEIETIAGDVASALGCRFAWAS